MSNTPEGLQLLKGYVQAMCQLIVQVGAARPASEDGLCASALALTGDLLRAYQMEILPFVESEQVSILLQKCRRSKVQKAKTVSSWVTREIAKVKRQ